MTNKALYSRHHKTHTRPFRCEECQQGFGLKSNLMRHKNFHHTKSHIRFFCGFSDCKYSALRSDHLKHHMWSVHLNDGDGSCMQESTIVRLFQNSVGEQQKMSQSHLLLSALAQENSVQVDVHLANGADPNSVDPEGATALHFAIARGNNQLVRALLEAGARVNVEDSWGLTGIQAAMEFRQKDAKITQHLHRPILTNHKGIIREKFEKGIETGLRKYRALLRLLLSYAMEQSSNNDWVPNLLYAAVNQKRDIEVINAILTSVTGFDPEGIFKVTALCMAARTGFLEAVDILLDNGAHPNACGARVGETALHKAAQGGHVEILKVLLRAGADPKVKDRLGNTTLHAAAEGGSLEAFKILLENGADTKAVNAFQKTALDRTTASISQEVSKLLIQNGADLEARIPIER